jgi:hypothetical protein
VASTIKKTSKTGWFLMMACLRKVLLQRKFSLQKTPPNMPPAMPVNECVSYCVFRWSEGLLTKYDKHQIVHRTIASAIVGLEQH